MIAGISFESIYFYLLIICAVLAMVMLIFGDIFEFDGPIDPILVIPWFAFLGLFGYLGEKLTALNSFVILIGAGILASILVFLLNFYFILPMRRAESTISISEKDMEGNVATVITPIPIKGMGEIQFKSVTGSLSRPAAFFEPQETEALQGSQVLIIEVKERVCYVVPYQGSLPI
ncbi:hypothetical protein [Enterococcus sp. HY326]|uniref:hypothetical protein n=1 Tax=Enterococcus sp. HY326 TaxID=2971265 RepID=UPI002240D4E4|nr:hypothetical protein [Enterococcus sp. HY326]